MSEETYERYKINVGPDYVWIHDTKLGTSAGTFLGESRLMQASARLDQLNAAESHGACSDESHGESVTEPDRFLRETLPKFAAKQRTPEQVAARRGALLAEVTELQDEALRMITEGSIILQRALDLGKRIEKDVARVLSTLQSAQEGSAVPEEGSGPQKGSQPRVRVTEDGYLADTGGYLAGIEGVLEREYSWGDTRYRQVMLDGESFSRTYLADRVEILSAPQQSIPVPRWRSMFKPGPF